MSAGERLEDGRLISGKLAVIRKIAGALADELRHDGGDELRTRGVLFALIVAIEQGQLDSLYRHTQVWIRAEVARQNALAAEPEAAGHEDYNNR